MKAFLQSIVASGPAARWLRVDPLIREPDADPYRVPEAVIQDVWNAQHLDPRRLYTIDGHRIRVKDPGRWNLGHGPDFIGARLTIGDVHWNGDVEVHRTSADWTAHGHDQDARYNAVVLHVTLVRDGATGDLRRADGTSLPELVLYPHLTASLRRLIYRFYLARESPIACADSWASVPAELRSSLIAQSARDRLTRRADGYALFEGAIGDPVEHLYRQAFRALGYAPNAEAMEQLATRVPLTVAHRQPDHTRLTELLLTTSGLGGDRATGGGPDGPEPSAIEPMHVSTWTTSQVRPTNNPLVRILQGASWLQEPGWLASDPTGRLLAILEDSDPLPGLRRLVACPTPTSAAPAVPALGSQRRDVILANVLVPYLLFLGEVLDKPQVTAAAWDILRRLPAAPNRISAIFQRLGQTPANAEAGQGLYELYQSSCRRGRCLSCPVGRRILEGTRE